VFRIVDVKKLIECALQLVITGLRVIDVDVEGGRRGRSHRISFKWILLRRLGYLRRFPTMVGMSDCVNSIMLQRDDDNGGLAAVIEGDQMHCWQDDVIGCWDGVKLRLENDDEECSRAIDGDHMHCSEGLHIGDVIGTVLIISYR
jgi:hypothetical protein